MNKIPVFFIEKENSEIINQIKSKVPNSLFPEHNSDLAMPCTSYSIDVLDLKKESQ